MIKATNKTGTKRPEMAIKLKALNKRSRYNTPAGALSISKLQNLGGCSIVQLILSTIGLFQFENFVGYIKGRIFDGGLNLFFEPNG